MDTEIPTLDMQTFTRLEELPGTGLRVAFGPTVAAHRLEKRATVGDGWHTVGPLADVLERPDAFGPLAVKAGEPFLNPSQRVALLAWAADVDLQAAADLVAQEPDERAQRRAALPFEPDELAELDALTRAHTAFDDLLAMLEALGGYRPTLWLDASVTGRKLARLADAYDKAQAHRGDARRAFRGW